jgi:hypothetical protein
LLYSIKCGFEVFFTQKSLSQEEKGIEKSFYFEHRIIFFFSALKSIGYYFTNVKMKNYLKKLEQGLAWYS